MEELRNIKSNRALIPVWQTASIRPGSVYSNCSDQGCCGLDINITQSTDFSADSCIEVQNLKEQTNKFTLRAEECCSPFLEPNEDSDLKDPCLAKVDSEQKKEFAFWKQLFFGSRCEKRDTVIQYLRPIWDQLQDEDSRENLLQQSITLPRGIFDLLKKFPGPFSAAKSNWLYSGNSMCATKNKILLHSGGSRTSDLVLTSLFECKAENGLLFSGRKEEVIKLKGGPIYGISYKQILGRDICMVRKQRSLRILFLEDKSATPVAVLKNKADFACASLSPHIPGEYVSVDSNGNLELHTFKHSVSLWQNKLSHSDQTVPETNQHWVCDFGSHPRGLLYMDRTGLSMADTRRKNCYPLRLFTTKNKCLFPSEELFTFQQSVANPFQFFVSTTYHLVLIDERFPSIPMQFWKHQLSSCPTLLWQGNYPESYQSSVENQLILVACHRPHETCCIQVRPAAPQPFSLSPPWFCSGPQDPCRILKHHGFPVPKTYERRSAFPVTGVCIVPHTSGVTIFHQTSVGDLFCQDYFLPDGTHSESSHRFGPGYFPPNPDKLSERVCSWVRNVQGPEEQTPETTHFQWIQPSTFFDSLLDDRPQSKNCNFCAPVKIDPERSDEKCSTCQLDLQTTSSIMQSKGMLGILPSGVPVKGGPPDLQWLFKLTNLKRGFDPFTESLLREWDLSGMGCLSQPEDKASTSAQNLGTISQECASALENLTDIFGEVIEVGREDEEQNDGADMTNISQSSKRGSQELEDDDDLDIIPPSQNLDDLKRNVQIKRLSFLQNKRTNTAGF